MVRREAGSMVEGTAGPEPRKEAARGLKSRRAVKAGRPSFRRQEGYRHARLRDAWRRPRGKHSKLRRREKPRGRLPGAGYGSPRQARGLNRLGYREVRVSTARELESLNPREEMAVLAGSLGRKRRDELIKLAGEKGIHVANA
jgi:large subunit ribosomal protein L32e